MNSVCKQLNRKTDMQCSKVNAARQQKRTLILRESKDKTCTCPVKGCENRISLAKRAAENMWALITDCYFNENQARD